MNESYFKMIKEFPLVQITEETYDSAIKHMEKLLKLNLDEGEKKYFEVLTDQIWLYEQRKYPDMIRNDPVELLQYLMDSKEMKQTSLSKRTGICISTISMILRNQRKMSIDHILKIAKVFKVSPALFLPES